MKKLTKRGQVAGLQGFVMAVVTIGIVLAIGLIVLNEMQTSALATDGSTTAASNATGQIITKLAGAPTWIGLLIIVVFATAVLAFFYMRA